MRIDNLCPSFLHGFHFAIPEVGLTHDRRIATPDSTRDRSLSVTRRIALIETESFTVNGRVCRGPSSLELLVSFKGFLIPVLSPLSS